MILPILATKLHIPPNRRGLVSRSRLLERLEEGLANGSRLTFVSAPAGYGKTTLVREWLSNLGLDEAVGSSHPDSTGRAFTWLSLDDGDNDLARFLRYFIAALQRIDACIGQTTLELLGASSLPPNDVSLTLLVNDLTGRREQFFMVLDDYHLIHSLAVHQWVDAFLEKQPPNVHLVVTTRADPLLRLSRLRARGQLTEIRSEDLRFTTGETVAFLRQTMGLGLQPELVSLLEKQTEGWIAGIQLTALSLPKEFDPAKAGQVLMGADRYVMDYLVEEVLGLQPEWVQEFLLKTSILDRMCPELCDAVVRGGEPRTENRESEGEGCHDSCSSALDSRLSTLEQLERANLFVIPSDHECCWYRYHRLFADLLQHQLRQRSPEQIPEFHRRAARWFDRNGFPDEAVQHALKARDFDLALDLIARIVLQPSYWSLGGVDRVMAWLAEIPVSVREGHLNLEIALVRAFGMAGRYEEMRRSIDRLEDRLRREPQDDPAVQELQGETALNRFLYDVMVGDMVQAKTTAGRALEKIPETRLYSRSRAYFSLGLAHDLVLNFPPAIEAYERALELSQEEDAYFAHAYTIADLGAIYFTQGKLHKCEELARGFLDRERQAGKRIHLGCGVCQQIWLCLYERNRLEEAQAMIDDGLERIREGGMMDRYGWGHFMQAINRQARGKAAEAREAQAKAERLLALYPVGEGYLHRARAFQVQLWLLQGDLDKASQWARSFEKACARPVDKFSEYLYLDLARVWIAEGRNETALPWLDGWIQNAEEGRRAGHLVAWYAYRALCTEGLGKRDRALADLARSLSLAEPEGYVRSLVDLGEPMRKLLVEFVGTKEKAGLRKYAAKLLGEFPLAEAAQGLPVQDLVEPLTSRELEVLNLIAEGLSNQEISEKLYFSPNTLKAHTQSIYGKLDVHSRVQAINKAKELGILE